jgi:hypothetical protein
VDSTVVILLVVAVVIVIALIVVSRARAKRSEALQERFGPEYGRTVEEAGDQRAAEKQLSEREQRREKLQIRELDPGTRERYLIEWRDSQSRFVDDPSPAVRDADSLIMNVMRDRGYPVDDFEQRAEDISVDHPHVVDNYRAAHRISLADEQGQATTEDLRQAMVHYRYLFDDLLGETTSSTADSRVTHGEASAGALGSDDPSLGDRNPNVEHVDLRQERNPRSPG